MTGRRQVMQTQADEPYRVEMLGGLRFLRQGDVVVRFPPQKPGALLAYLAYFTDRIHPREELLEVLWPEVEPTAGRNRLKQTLSVLRAELEPADVPEGCVLRADRASIGLNTRQVTTDVADFEEARRQAQQGAPDQRLPLLDRVVRLYRGALLPGFYDEWVIAERERLARLFVDTLLELTAALESGGDLSSAVAHARRAIEADSLKEESHAALMRLYAAQGRRSEAARQYRELERLLREELGEAPSPDTQALYRSLRNGRSIAPAAPPSSVPNTADRLIAPARLEPVGGAVPLLSPFYIVRATDREFADAIARRDSLVLVKGPRQIGKTSLLARGLEQARRAGARVVLSDLQQLTGAQMETAETLFRTLSEAMTEQLELDLAVRDVWDPERGWNVNFERFLRREALGQTESHLVWGLDEVDRLFNYSYGSEVFGLFRSWHNLRALHPSGPWGRLTLAMAYATEAHLFITDLNQSPFNVGTRLTLEDFTPDDVAELNRRYGRPLRISADIARFYVLLGGSPYLVRRGLHEMVIRQADLPAFEAVVKREDGPFHDHLRYLTLQLSRDPAMAEAVRETLQGGTCSIAESFYRLRSAGVLAGEPSAARFRCALYADYLQGHLP